MKLTQRLTALLVLGNCVVLTGYGFLTRQREVRMFERAMERDTFLAGSTLLATLDGVWRLHGAEAARDLIEVASARQADMSFRYLELQELGSTGLSPAQVAQLEGGERAFERSGGALRMYVPYSPPTGPPGVVEVTQDTTQDQAYVRSSSLLLLGATGASVLLSGLLAYFVGAALVGRPVKLLVERVKHVASGDLSARLDLSRRDEIGALAGALDRMSADLERARAEAEAEARERRAALDRLRHAERLATVGRLAAGVAHELGTPLNVVLARAQLIERRPHDPDKVTKHAEVVRQQTQRMTRIIRQLLDFARRGSSERVPADLAELVESELEALRPLAAEREVELSYSGPSPAPAFVDPGHIGQVLTNLVVNAIQASPRGGQVRVDLNPAPEGWTLLVSDQGPGIPADLRERVLEPFFTTKDVGEGTGLGLTVVHGIVSEHGGALEIESEPGQGCRIRVSLPTPAAVPEAARA